MATALKGLVIMMQYVIIIIYNAHTEIPAGGIYFSSYEWMLQLMNPQGNW